ncbi:MAG: NADH-ubiquinone oxidoreductase chain I, partial [uncultured Thermomicrobiales bacterium]
VRRSQGLRRHAPPAVHADRDDRVPRREASDGRPLPRSAVAAVRPGDGRGALRRLRPLRPDLPHLVPRDARGAVPGGRPRARRVHPPLRPVPVLRLLRPGLPGGRDHDEQGVRAQRDRAGRADLHQDRTRDDRRPVAGLVGDGHRPRPRCATPPRRRLRPVPRAGDRHRVPEEAV